MALKRCTSSRDHLGPGGAGIGDLLLGVRERAAFADAAFVCVETLHTE